MQPHGHVVLTNEYSGHGGSIITSKDRLYRVFLDLICSWMFIHVEGHGLLDSWICFQPLLCYTCFNVDALRVH